MNAARRSARALAAVSLVAAITIAPAPPTAASGDGIDTPGVMRDKGWWLSNVFGGTGDHVFSYGADGDYPVIGDWNGDGIDTPGVVRGDRWFLTDSYGGAPRPEFAYGLVGDTPVVGDWNGDGIDTPGMQRGDEWALSNSFGGTGDILFKYGVPGDTPVVGDWNGDGIDTPGMQRGDEWALSNSFGGTGDILFKYGLPGDIPLVGDWHEGSTYDEPTEGDPAPPGDEVWSDDVWGGSGEIGDRQLQSVEGIPTVVNRYAPQVRLHPDERHFPASARSGFVAHAELRWAHDDGCFDFRAARAGQIDSYALGHGGYWHRQTDLLCLHYGRNYYSDERTRPRDGGKAADLEFSEGFFLDVPNSAEPWVYPGNRDLGSVPSYFEYGDLADGGHYITYWFFYPYNHGQKGFNHEGDWERIAIRLTPKNNPSWVALYRHSCERQIQWSNVQKVAGTSHPIVWSARGGHGSYESPGSHANCEDSRLSPDETGTGPAETHQWNVWKRLANVRRQTWFGFGGAWGEIGTAWPLVGPGVTTGPLGPRYKAPTPWCPCTPVN